MPDIGTTLRETRMRERIDIVEVESATKIRAKYLRALENEEWDLLPGPTFVRTFLRTYAEYLGLDPKPIVEEYKQRYDRPGPQDLLPFGGQRGGRRQQQRARALPPAAIIAGVVVVLLVALYLIGTSGKDDGGGTAATSTPTATATPARKAHKKKRAAAAPTRVRVQIVPTGTVNVCLVDGSGHVLIPSQNLGAGSPTRVFRAKRFRVTFGNGFAKLRVGGRVVDVPDRQDPVGYDIRPGRAPRELPAGQRPTCAE